MKFLFGERERVKERLKDKRIFLFLDYDGTLAPIVNNPKKLFIPKEIKDLLSRLSKTPGCKLAVISGRDVKDIVNAIGISRIIYSGNHGFQIDGPKVKFEAPVSRRYKTALKQIKNDLKKGLSSIDGIFVEDKGLSLSLHYRKVNKKKIPKVKAVFHKIILPYLIRNNIKTNAGKMLLEVRPPSAWDKGKAVLRLLKREGAALKNGSLVPIYIGDDKTDEDAFKVLKDKGITVFVGAPKPSYARYYLKDTDEVKEFLNMILSIQRGAVS